MAEQEKTTKLVSLSLIKKQVEVIHDEDDDLLVQYELAAMAAFESTTNRKLISSSVPLPDPIGNTIQADESILQGILLLIGHWYANRESVTTGTIATKLPQTVDYLWKQHRWINV